MTARLLVALWTNHLDRALCVLSGHTVKQPPSLLQLQQGLCLVLSSAAGPRATSHWGHRSLRPRFMFTVAISSLWPRPSVSPCLSGDRLLFEARSTQR
jgi:hypothetical protein